VCCDTFCKHTKEGVCRVKGIILAWFISVFSSRAKKTYYVKLCSILYTCFVHQKLVTRAHLLELSGRCILLKFKNAMNFCSGLFIASYTGSYGRCNCTCIGVPYLTVLLLVSEQWAVLASVFTLQMLCRRLVSRCCSLGLDE